MFFRHLFSRAARPRRHYFNVDVRGKKDVPVWRPPQVADFFRRPSMLDDPWFREFWGPSGFRTIDEFLRENVRRMDAMLKTSPWQVRDTAREHGTSADIIHARFGKHGLQMEMDGSDFGHEDISVKLSGDRLVISGKHTSKPDEHGFVAREFTREFLVPENIDTESLACRLTDEGHLIISAKVKGEPETSHDIAIERETSEQKESGDKTKEEKE